MKLSIIIPTYNRATVLPRAITSVINQPFKDLELIIIDDGSTDNTEETVKAFLKNEKRMRYIKLASNKLLVRLQLGAYQKYSQTQDVHVLLQGSCLDL